MVDKIKKISSPAIIVFTALLLVGLFVAKGLLGFVTEVSARKNGSLGQYTLSATDFHWNGIAEKEGQIITTDNDPQMILEESKMIQKEKSFWNFSFFSLQTFIKQTILHMIKFLLDID